MANQTRRTLLAAVVLAGLCRANLAANTPQANSAASLTAAVLHLISTFGDRYPKGRQFLGAIDRLKPEDDKALAELQRRSLLANPLLGGRRIVFVTRRQYSNNHGTEATMCQRGEINTSHFRGGGAVKTLDLPAGKVATILEMPKGIIRDPEVHFDAGKLLFSMRKDINDDYHLYEMDIPSASGVGVNLKQLTFAPRVSDIQPIYLPGGRIAFSSTREPKYIPCQRHLMSNLFVMDGDGANIRQIGHNTQFEGRPSLTSDGRILYTRWEYVDKHFASAYGLWTVNPDGTNWNHYNNKRILGRAPVEADGSAYFSVPAGRFVYFQLLGENGMMIHSMRSGTMLQPGEEAGCIGCHEDRLKPAPPSRTKRPTAMKRPPSKLAPWYGPARNFSYATEVQPVLDKHCVRCHDYGKEAPKINLSGDKGPAFSLSYTNLLARSPAVWRRPAPGAKKPLISSVGAGPIKVIPPYSWGARASSLVDLLRNDHGKEKVKLDAESIDRIVTWIDLNVPYYPSHATYYGDNTFGRCPLNHKDLARLGKLTKKYPWSQVNSYSVRPLNALIMTQGSPINFTRPEKSLCLTGFTDKKDPDYIEALELIRRGRQILIDHPRLDMEGFKPRPSDQARLDYHAKRQEIEKRNRRAIVEGRKVYDKRPVISNQ